MTDAWGASEQLVGRWDPDARLYIATGWTYGPAGPATVEVSPTVTLTVDYANPHVTSEITIEAPIDGDPRLLDADTERVARSLLGPSTLYRLLDLAQPGGARQPSRISDEFGFGDPKQGLRQDALGQFTLLVETATDPDAPRLKAALAGIEAAGVAPIADPSLHVLMEAARGVAQTGADTLLTLAADRSLELEDFRLEQELSAAIRRAARILDDEVLVRRLGRLLRDLDEGVFRSRPPVAAMATPSMAPPPRARRRAEPTGPPVEIEGPPSASARQVAPTEIEVHAADGRDDQWARVFRRSDRLLLALAPLRSRRGASEALLVIPTGFAPADLLVDITDDPAAARPSADLAVVRAAVAAGREACRLERTRDDQAAARRWTESAEAWEAVGSPERAETARRYSYGDRWGPRTQPRRGRGALPQTPFLADRVD